MHIEYMLISGASFNYDNALFLMSIPEFNGYKTKMYESKRGIFIICDFEISEKAYKLLYKKIKNYTGADHIDIRYYEKNCKFVKNK